MDQHDMAMAQVPAFGARERTMRLNADVPETLRVCGKCRDLSVMHSPDDSNACAADAAKPFRECHWLGASARSSPVAPLHTRPATAGGLQELR